MPVTYTQPGTTLSSSPLNGGKIVKARFVLQPDEQIPNGANVTVVFDHAYCDRLP